MSRWIFWPNKRRIRHVDLQVPISKAEAKIFMRTCAQSVWQEYWDDNETGRHLYNIQRHVGAGRMVGWKRREENIITRLRIGHTGLSHTLHKIDKNPSGKCKHCSQSETVEHVHCRE